jgi:hypothetical protein
MRIFFGLNVTSRVAISKVVLKIQPYYKEWDVLGLLSDTLPREYVPMPVKAKGAKGQMEIIAPVSDSSSRSVVDWNKLLSYLAYKLDLPINMPHACPLFTNDQYQRTFSVYVIDRYGRYSNAVTRRLKVITCKCSFFHH